MRELCGIRHVSLTSHWPNVPLWSYSLWWNRTTRKIWEKDAQLNWTLYKKHTDSYRSQPSWCQSWPMSTFSFWRKDHGVACTFVISLSEAIEEKEMDFCVYIYSKIDLLILFHLVTSSLILLLLALKSLHCGRIVLNSHYGYQFCLIVIGLQFIWFVNFTFVLVILCFTSNFWTQEFNSQHWLRLEWNHIFFSLILLSIFLILLRYPFKYNH